MTRVDAFTILWNEGDKTRNDFDNAVSVAVWMDEQGLLERIATAKEFDDAFWQSHLPEPDVRPVPSVNDQRTDLLQALDAAGIRRPL